ncbi:MAG: hypothetical protein U0U46_14325 [Saprospiraceae bacterium]
MKSVFSASLAGPLAFLFLVVFSACYEPKKGCLDIEAVNFDATADENCCCNYPRLFVRLEHRYDTLTFREGDAYPQSSGHWFRLQKVIFYLSDFKVFRNSDVFGVTDSLKMKVFGPATADTLEQYLTNDFVLVRRTPLEFAAGAFPESGTFDRVRCRLGLPDAAQSVIPGKAPANHPLSEQPEKLWLDRTRGFEAMRIIFNRDTLGATAPDTLTLARPDFDNFMLEGSGTFVHESGYDFYVLLVADYKALFQDVDLTQGSPASWKAQIVANLQNALQIQD